MYVSFTESEHSMMEEEIDYQEKCYELEKQKDELLRVNMTYIKDLENAESEVLRLKEELD